MEKTIAQLAPRRVLLMHCDRFEPGDFICNVDRDSLGRELARRFLGTEFLAPRTGTWLNWEIGGEGGGSESQ